MRAEYLELLPPNHPDLLCGVRMIWHGERCVLQAEDGDVLAAFRVLEPSLKPALACLLMGWIVERHDPNRLLLHANVLAHEPTGRLLFLPGDSGTGKSTLTRGLLEHDAAWALAAEDMAILDPERRHLLPFPRPSSLRIVDGVQTEELAIWSTFGSRGGEKALHPPSRFVTETQDLRKAVVCLLEPPPAPDSPEQVEPAEVTCTFQLSYASDELVSAVRDAGYAEVDLRFGSGIAFLRIGGPLGAEDHIRLCQLFDQHEAFLLQAGFGGGGQSGQQRFATKPSCRAISGSRAMGLLERHLKRHRPVSAYPDVAHPLFRLVRCLHDATFLELTPGGTPEETLAAIGLEDLLDQAS